MQKIFLLLISYVLIVTTTIASAQENLFKKNFQRQSPTDFQSFEKTIDTKIMKGWDQDKDKIKMLEEGFDLMGFSGFSGPNISPNFAKIHGEELKADLVLIYDRQVNDSSRASAIKKARDKVFAARKAEKKGEIIEIEITEEDLLDSNALYVFYASYWVKLPKPTFGTHFIKIAKNNVQDEVPGALVIAVIKDSPAAKAGILKNDSIVKIDQVDVNSPDDLIAVIKKSKGKSVDVEFIRGGIKDQVTVNL
jgi:membrane-associated protease RseP (regulator of RpoE activity)